MKKAEVVTTTGIFFLIGATFIVTEAVAGCQDGERCVIPPDPPCCTFNPGQEDADLDDGRTFPDISEPDDRPTENGRDGPGDEDG